MIRGLEPQPRRHRSRDRHEEGYQPLNLGRELRERVRREAEAAGQPISVHVKRILEQHYAAQDGKASEDLRYLYIGAASFCCQLYSSVNCPGTLGYDRAMERFAKDFNAQGFALEIARNESGWALQARDPFLEPEEER